MQKKPNFLWVSFEDTNPFYGCYGDKVARTPVLDQLAKEGTLFKKCFATSGVCAPARSAVITGMYPTFLGTHHMRTSTNNESSTELPTPYSAVVPHYVKCFSEYLRREGYYCTNNDKTDYQFTPPFTAWDELGPKAHWRNRKNKDQPFLAVFNPMRTHESCMWEENCPGLKFDPADIIVPPTYPDTPKVRECLARMYTLIETSDTEFGQRLKDLEEDGLLENTIIMHWSDHGPLPRGKRWPYDLGIHVPLIIKGPGIEKGKIVEDLVSSMDLGPTVLSLAGIDVPNYMHGQALIGNQAKEPREYIHATRDRHDESYDMVRAIRDKKFKYIRHFHPELPYLILNDYLTNHPIHQEMCRLYMNGERNKDYLAMFKKRPTEELYDLEKDPHELNNVAKNSEYQSDLNRLSKKLDEWRKEIIDLGELTEEQMIRIWYPNGVQPTTFTPKIIVRDQIGQKVSPDATYEAKGNALVHLHCSTQGASLGYTFDKGEDVHWSLYSQPLKFTKGTYNFRVKAIRIGFKESSTVEVSLTVK